MKLYDVPENSKLLIGDEEYTFHHTDCMHSYCTNKDGNVCHFSANTEFTKENNLYILKN